MIMSNLKYIIIKIMVFKKVACILFTTFLIKDSAATYSYTRFPIGIGGSNNNMEYLVVRDIRDIFFTKFSNNVGSLFYFKFFFSYHGVNY